MDGVRILGPLKRERRVPLREHKEPLVLEGGPYRTASGPWDGNATRLSRVCLIHSPPLRSSLSVLLSVCIWEDVHAGVSLSHRPSPSETAGMSLFAQCFGVELLRTASLSERPLFIQKTPLQLAGGRTRTPGRGSGRTSGWWGLPQALPAPQRTI